MKAALAAILLAVVFLLPSVPASAGEKKDGKILILYYSLSGRTKAVAEKLQAKTGADIYAIQTVKTYPDSYPGVYEEPKRELEENDLPALKTAPPDLAPYDLILVGSPVWWYTVSTPLMKFLQEVDFKGKKVASFCTYDTTLGQYHAHFAEQARNATVLEGVSFSYPHRMPAGELDKKLTAWLASLKK